MRDAHFAVFPIGQCRTPFFIFITRCIQALQRVCRGHCRLLRSCVRTAGTLTLLALRLRHLPF
jgi:hypothetical protein